MSKLSEIFLSSKSNIPINTELAVEIGLNETIVLRQVYYWIEHNKSEKKNYIDGKYWVYNSIKQWKIDNFPFMSEKTIERAFNSLRKKNLILVGDYSTNRMKRPNWYTVNEKEFDKLIKKITKIENQDDKQSEENKKINETDSLNAYRQNDGMQSDIKTDCYNIYNNINNKNSEITNRDYNKADTSSNDNVKADTAFPKKSLNVPKQKKTRLELIELEKDMYMRFGIIGREYDVSETVYKNIIRTFSRYLIRHRQKTGKTHPILKDETLEKIFVTLASIQDLKYNHFDNIADYEPEDGELSYLEQMVDEHFDTEHKKGTDWHISHFAVPEYLEKMAQHIAGY